MNNGGHKTAFIPAAGMGTRLKELTQSMPKALVPLNGKPMLHIIIDNLICQGFDHFVINVHHFANQIMTFISKMNYHDMVIDISDESNELIDTGGAILKALPFFKCSEAVLIHNVDIISDIDFMPYYQSFVKSEDAVWLFTQKRKSRRMLAFDANDNFVERVVMEEPTLKETGDTTRHLYAFSGIHLIKPQYFAEFEIKPCYVFDLYTEMAARHSIKSMPVNPLFWFDIGTKEKLKEAESWLLQKR